MEVTTSHYRLRREFLSDELEQLRCHFVVVCPGKVFSQLQPCPVRISSFQDILAMHLSPTRCCTDDAAVQSFVGSAFGQRPSQLCSILIQLTSEIF